MLPRSVPAMNLATASVAPRIAAPSCFFGLACAADSDGFPATSYACGTTEPVAPATPSRMNDFLSISIDPLRERVRNGFASPAGGGRHASQPDRLHQRPVGRNVPCREPHPFLAGGVERDLKPFLPECRQIGRGNDLPVRGFPVTPHDLYEIQRKGPFDIGGDCPLCPGPFHGIRGDEHFARGHEIVAAVHGIDDWA